MNYADADLVAAVLKPSDHLKHRAEAFLAKEPVLVPFSVGIELLFLARKLGLPHGDFIALAARRFEVERADVLRTAALALDEGDIGTVFDAVHAAASLVDGRSLVTTDKRILASDFPAVRF